MTLYLSLLHLSRKLPEWQQFDAYQAHQVVWKAFPDVPKGAERPFLFSLDDRGSYYSLLVQSTAKPRWDTLSGKPDIRVKAFDPTHIQTGTELRYFLRANPTVDRKYADGETRRVGIGLNRTLQAERMGVDPEEVPQREKQLTDWLKQRGEAGGFTVETCLAGPTITRQIWRTARPKRGERPMTLHEVELTGKLRVTNPEAFAQTLARGVGRGKAFGYGLLMVRPVGD